MAVQLFIKGQPATSESKFNHISVALHELRDSMQVSPLSYKT
jgi:hypothetical protein